MMPRRRCPARNLMLPVAFSLSAILLYLAATARLALPVLRGGTDAAAKPQALALAAVAVVLAYQERQLRRKRLAGAIRALPPLQTMETLLFQLIGAGFFLLSLAIVSGAMFVDNLFGRGIGHKTVLSVIAWLILGILLWGRWRFGWRGRVAIRWSLGGFFALMLAYFGSKFVLELILQR
jgi:ABC-type uncharacterized transport system permease subunit